MGSEISLPCFGEGDQATAARDSDGVMRVAGHQGHRRCDMFGYVHMYLSVPPKYSPSFVMKILKGKSAEYLRKEFPELGKKYWVIHIWARGYFVSIVGINSTVIQNYVKNKLMNKFARNSLCYGRTTANNLVRSCRLLQNHRQGRW